MRRLVLCFMVSVAGAVVAGPATVAAAGGGCHQPNPTEGSGQTVRLSGNCISPAVLTAEAGEITFINDDPILHNVTGSGLFEELASDETFKRRFSAGTYPFSCTLHPGMNGVLIVGEGRTDPSSEATPIAATPAAAASAASASGDGVARGVLVFGAVALAAPAGYVLGRRRRV